MRSKSFESGGDETSVEVEEGGDPTEADAGSPVGFDDKSCGTHLESTNH